MSEATNGADPGGTGGNHRKPEAQPHPRMWLQPFLLLALEQWESHGYELIRRMTAFGFEALDRGSVYRVLRQLEKDGLVRWGWDRPKEGPARGLSRLAEAGGAYLNVWAPALRGSQAMLARFFPLSPPPRPAQRGAAPQAKARGCPPAAAPRGGRARERA